MFAASPRPRLVSATIIVLLALVATACGGGVRPTLTSDRLEEITPVATATAIAAAPTAVVAPTTEPDTNSEAAAGSITEVEQLVVEVLESFPHDTTAFTQGLELDNGVFIESTGLNGESDLRRVIPETGEVTQIVATPNNFFAEGVTRVGDQLIQLTWQENTAFYWDAATFELQKEVSYPGEGWGLCFDGSRLVMTDGTPVLIFRDPTTFDEISRIDVTLDGQQVFNLNEIECVGDVVWANIWQTDLIVRIDPARGVVTAVVDASSLDSPNEPSGAVLNGIAWDESTQSFYVTGKLWPTMYRVNFVPAPAS